MTKNIYNKTENTSSIENILDIETRSSHLSSALFFAAQVGARKRWFFLRKLRQKFYVWTHKLSAQTHTIQKLSLLIQPPPCFPHSHCCRAQLVSIKNLVIFSLWVVLNLPWFGKSFALCFFLNFIIGHIFAFFITFYCVRPWHLQLLPFSQHPLALNSLLLPPLLDVLGQAVLLLLSSLDGLFDPFSRSQLDVQPVLSSHLVQ